MLCKQEVGNKTNLCFLAGVYTANGWPHGLLNSYLWDHCSEFGCDGVARQVWSQSDAGSAVSVNIRASGNYCGWADRNQMVSTALNTQGGQAGSNSAGKWTMPSSTFMRNNADGG